MAKPLCMNYTNSSTDRYSSPVPFVGLYIVGATLVCLLLMLIDIISGLRHKLPYIPCRFFSFNSATLTLIGVASKLPVDLTTYMPSARDQLSKLTGTAMVCICIGFAMPSLGVNRPSESITNMIALSFLIITIFVNICIQMSTGIIYSFVVEHIAILCCMLMLLFMLWFSTLKTNDYKLFMPKWHRDLFNDTRVIHSLQILDYLKVWCMRCRIMSPQLLLWNSYSGVVVDCICLSCCVVLSQATFRSLIVSKFEYCEGISDYGWSMWIILISQIATIMIGGLTIGFRWLVLILLEEKVQVNDDPTMLNIIKIEMKRFKKVFLRNDIFPLSVEYQDFSFQFSLLKMRSMKMSIVSILRFSIKFVTLVTFVLIFLIVAFVPLCISIILAIPINEWCSSRTETTSNEDNYHFGDLWDLELWIRANEQYLYMVSGWMGRQCVKDMNKWVNRKKGEDSTYRYMVQMLSTVDESSFRTLVPLCCNNYIPNPLISEDYKITCLLMVVLVKILSASTSSPRVEALRHVLDETFEICYFIDGKINVGNSDDERRRELAKLLWASGDIGVSKRDSEHGYGSVEYLQYVLLVVQRFRLKSLNHAYLEQELLVLKRIIVTHRGCKTDEELFKCGEELFATMLHYYLAQLPSAIRKEVDSCPVEEMEDRAQVLLKLLGGILESSLLSEVQSSRESKMEWVTPMGVAS